MPRGRRYSLVVVLSHSRLLWLSFYRRQTMAVLTAGLESAFARFGGVPKELLFDQMWAVVSMGIENVPLFWSAPLGVDRLRASN